MSNWPRTPGANTGETALITKGGFGDGLRAISIVRRRCIRTHPPPPPPPGTTGQRRGPPGRRLLLCVRCTPGSVTRRTIKARGDERGCSPRPEIIVPAAVRIISYVQLSDDGLSVSNLITSQRARAGRRARRTGGPGFGGFYTNNRARKY